MWNKSDSFFLSKGSIRSVELDVNVVVHGRASTASGCVSPPQQLTIWQTTASLSRLCQHDPNACWISIITSRPLSGRRTECDSGHKGAGHGACWAGAQSQPVFSFSLPGTVRVVLCSYRSMSSLLSTSVTWSPAASCLRRPSAVYRVSLGE